MTIRRKTILVIGGMSILIIPLLMVILWVTVLNNFNKVENDAVLQNLERAVNSIETNIKTLNNTVGDWSSWNESYNFIENVNQEYIDNNLMDATLTGLNVNFMVFVDLNGNVIHSKSVDFQSGEEVSLPAGYLSFLTPNNPMVNMAPTDQIKGILIAADMPAIISARPILTNEDLGPVRGTLIMGRFLDDSEIAQLSESTQLSLSYVRLNDTAMPDDFSTAAASITKNEPAFIHPMDSQTIAGYTVLNDIYGNPGLIIKLDMNRDIYRQGWKTLEWVTMSLVFFGFLHALVIILLLRYNIVSPMTRLAREVAVIGKNGNFSARVKVKGKDEIAGLATNINEMLAVLQQDEEKISRSEQYYRSIFATAGSAMAIADENYILQSVNTEFERLSGFNKDELEGKISWLQFIKPTKVVEVSHIQNNWLKEQSLTPRYFTGSFVNRNGDVKDIIININRIPGTTMFVASIVDITERSRFERELQRLYTQEAELREQLEADMKARIEFTRALVHELKTPLTPMLTASDMLLDELKDDKLIKFARNINRGSKRLNTRIDELFDVARGEMGTLMLHFSEVEPSVLLKEVIDEITPMTSERSQSLELVTPGSLSTVQADDDRLRQIMNNLLINASKYTPKGGKITVTAMENEGLLNIEVRDNGPGISEEDQQNMFKPYFRSKTNTNSGLGLGLALSKRLVELHGGRIWVNSTPGKGSTFGFSIPLKPPVTG